MKRNYGPTYPTEYVDFLMTKYRRERLKFEFAEVKSGYPDLLRLYTLDIVATSMQAENDFLRIADIQFIFENFLYFATDLSPLMFKNINVMKQLFISNKAHLVDHYELFNSLYDTVLFSGSYLLDWYSWAPHNIPSLFDDFLNSLLYWDSHKLLKYWKWQPSVEYFAVAIKVNYYFYKLINLSTFPQLMAEKQVEFKNFELRDDFLIHRFTLVPEIRELSFFLKKSLKVQGFNYHKFAGKTLEKGVTAAFVEYKNSRTTTKSMVTR